MDIRSILRDAWIRNRHLTLCSFESVLKILFQKLFCSLVLLNLFTGYEEGFGHASMHVYMCVHLQAIKSHSHVIEFKPE